MKNVLLVLLVLVLGAVGFLTWLGVVPVLSPLVVKAKDLGVKADPALVAAFDTKYGMKNELPGGVVPDTREPQYEGSVHLDVTLSSEEVTSILDYWRSQYGKTPIRDVQVRFNPDGTGEASGILEVGTAIAMAKQLGYSDSDIAKGKTYVQFVAGDLPFYVAGTASVTNGNVTLSPTALEVGRVSVPGSLVAPVMGAVEDAIERRIRQIPRIAVDSVTMQNGTIHVVADAPTTIK